jgi:lactoylglutathione lyase
MLSAVDFERSLWFYRDLLGGSVVYRFPEDEPVFVTLQLGDSELGIGGMAGSPLHGQPQRPATGHRIELCIYVDGIDELVASAQSEEVEVLVEPTDQPWGERVAYLRDPDGNLVMLASELATDG